VDTSSIYKPHVSLCIDSWCDCDDFRFKLFEAFLLLLVQCVLISGPTSNASDERLFLYDFLLTELPQPLPELKLLEFDHVGEEERDLLVFSSDIDMRSIADPRISPRTVSTHSEAGLLFR
jgi:hypothetical protein